MANYNFTQEQIDDMIEMYVNEKISAPQIAEKYHTSKSTIIYTLHKNGVGYRRDKFSPEEEKRVCELFQQYGSTKKVANIVGRSAETVRRVVKRKGLPYSVSKSTSKYNLDETYFDEINSDDKAYILGLICADGTIGQKRHNVTIRLQDTDKPILEEINSKLDSDRPLVFLDYKKVKDTYHNQYSLTIVNKHMWQSLINLGVVPNKSLTLEYPQIDACFQRSFIRGYLDGDGCIYKNKNLVMFLGTNNFIDTLKDIIEEQTGLKGLKYNTRSNDTTMRLDYFGKRKAPELLQWLYQDGDMCIARKKQTYLDRYVNNSLTK